MDPSSPWAAALITIGVGAISGGLTNAIAVWMLFNPHEERGFGPFRLRGAIPKNKARLATAIGKVVGEKLLTPADLMERLQAAETRAAFATAVDDILDDVLDREHGPLADHIDPASRQALESTLVDLGSRVADSLAEYAGSDEFAALSGRWADKLEGDKGAAIDGWLNAVSSSPEVADGVRRVVHSQLERMAADTAPLGEKIPAGLVPVVEQNITDAIPGAVNQLGTLLKDGSLRQTISTALRETFERAMRQMMIHERLIARLVMNERTMERVLTGLERTGVDRLTESLNSAAVRERVQGAINRGIHSVLERPLAERIAALGAERVAHLESTVSEWLLDVLRSNTLRSTILNGASGVLRERAPALLHSALSSDAGRQAVAGAVASSGQLLLARPVGKPSAWLGPAATASLRSAVHQRGWQWVEQQVPLIVSRLSIPAMVEEKVMGFSTERMEEIVRKVTQRELDLIVKLGYLLGAMVGALAFGINRLLG